MKVMSARRTSLRIVIGKDWVTARYYAAKFLELIVLSAKFGQMAHTIDMTCIKSNRQKKMKKRIKNFFELTFHTWIANSMLKRV